MLFAINGKASVQAPGERFGIIHELLGLPSVLPTNTTPAAPRPAAGSPEAAPARARSAQLLAQAMAADPDWLLVLDRGLATGGEDAKATDLAAIPAIAGSRAWREGRVFRLDPAAWYLAGGGYTVLEQTLSAFEAALGGNR